MTNSSTMERDDIHIAFGYNHFAGFVRCLTRGGKIVERAALLKNISFRRIQIFGTCLAESPTAEGNNSVLPVGDRKDDTIAEEIIGVRSIFGPPEQADFEQLRFGKVTRQHIAVYPDGPAPYFTLHGLGRHGALLEQWRHIKTKASDAVTVSFKLHM